MITIDVAEYCSACMDFDPDVHRCFTLTRGVTCLFCGLDYPCPHMPGLEEQVAMAHKLRKEIEKND